MKNSKRKLTDKTGCSEYNSKFENLRIKVNSSTFFTGCYFYNCTFVGKGSRKARFESCTNV